MADAEANHFFWRLIPLGRWRLAWTSLRRRRVRMVGAAEAGRFHPLPPEQPYPRRRPRIEKAPPEFFMDWLWTNPPSPPAGGMVSLERICSVSGGVLLTEQGQIIAESLSNTEDAEEFKPFRRLSGGGLTIRCSPLTPIRVLSGDYIYLRQFFDGNYGHWLIDLLPRIAIAAQFSDLSRCKIVVTDKTGGMGRIYRDSLALFGIEPEQIVEIRRRPVFFERLHYPLPVSRHPWVKSPRAIEILEGLPEKLGATRDGPKRLYVTRNSGKKRRLTNEEDILALLRPLGFVLVDPGKLSFADQVRTFAGAEQIVGNCGAGLTNLVFSRRGVSVFALTTPFMLDDFFWDLTDLKLGRFFSLHGVANEPAKGSKSDFSIDLAAFKPMLAEFLGEGALAIAD
ncbi:glycosyltransferase family 61 protein [uncultured Rhodoblastus sp.]|uniref:glycosyltransferase family 61 protein n=1 Tax=uncultured Rhodoblastus sp. TaxID=543037 RepID=UPI0025F7F97A|nr:glycosyltransferase family 61 protein [uncultured Rhodoblastus sp.]